MNPKQTARVKIGIWNTVIAVATEFRYFKMELVTIDLDKQLSTGLCWLADQKFCLEMKTQFTTCIYNSFG